MAQKGIMEICKVISIDGKNFTPKTVFENSIFEWLLNNHNNNQIIVSMLRNIDQRKLQPPKKCNST